MIRQKSVLAFMIISGLTAAFFLQPTEAAAWYRKKKHSFHRQHNIHRGIHYSYRHHDIHRGLHYSYRQHDIPQGLHYYHHRAFGKVVLRLPGESVLITVGGSRYHYYKGHYYRKMDHHGYVDVEAPIGAYISRLPLWADTVYTNGSKYHRYNGVYYRHTPHGYVVVKDPTYHHEKKRRGKGKGRWTVVYEY